MAGTITESTLVCPHCDHRETLSMQTDSCQWFHECTGCKRILTPRPGDCCVFCSWGDVPCPPIQAGGDCCG